jgi:hypothetical protein
MYYRSSGIVAESVGAAGVVTTMLTRDVRYRG